MPLLKVLGNGVCDGRADHSLDPFRSEGKAAKVRSFGGFFRGLPHRHKLAIGGNHAALASHDVVRHVGCAPNGAISF